MGTLSNVKIDPNLVLTNLFENYQNKVLCDVTLIAVADDERITAHRCVLHAANDYFRAMFASQFKERDLVEIPIPGIQGVILRRLVEFCYGVEIKISEKDVDETIKAAAQLQFNEIVQQCAKFYRSILRPSNCLGIGSMADLYNLEPLKEAAIICMLDQFNEVVMYDEFGHLPQDVLLNVLRNDDLNVENEEDVIRAAMKWILFDIDSRKASFTTLMDCVRFQYVKDSFMLDQFHSDCLQLDAINVFSRIVKARSAMAGAQRASFDFNGFYFISGNKDIGFSIDKYCLRLNVWQNVKEVAINLRYFGLVASGGKKIIIIGGQKNGTETVNTVFSIDMDSGVKTEFTPLLSSRLGLSAAIMNNQLFAIGGKTKNNSTLRTVERFQIEKREWTEVASMSEARAWSTSVVHLGSIFVFGGKNERLQVLNTAECYVPSIDEWKTLAPMRHGRMGATACASNGFIYVCGGGRLKHPVQAIERYDPSNNTWTELNFSLSSPRLWSAAAIGHGDWLYIAGGCNADNKPTNSFQKINLITGEVMACGELDGDFTTGHLIKTIL